MLHVQLLSSETFNQGLHHDEALPAGSRSDRCMSGLVVAGGLTWKRIVASLEKGRSTPDVPTVERGNRYPSFATSVWTRSLVLPDNGERHPTHQNVSVVFRTSNLSCPPRNHQNTAR